MSDLVLKIRHGRTWFLRDGVWCRAWPTLLLTKPEGWTPIVRKRPYHRVGR